MTITAIVRLKKILVVGLKGLGAKTNGLAVNRRRKVSLTLT
jgi:hypothetical protein